MGARRVTCGLLAGPRHARAAQAMRTSIIVGMPSSTAMRRALAVAEYMQASLLSTRIDGMPYATPRGATPSYAY